MNGLTSSSPKAALSSFSQSAQSSLCRQVVLVMIRFCVPIRLERSFFCFLELLHFLFLFSNFDISKSFISLYYQAKHIKEKNGDIKKQTQSRRCKLQFKCNANRMNGLTSSPPKAALSSVFPPPVLSSFSQSATSCDFIQQWNSSRNVDLLNSLSAISICPSLSYRYTNK